MAGLDFRILGPLEVRTPAGAVLPLGRRKLRRLLAVLLLSRDRPLSTELLVDLLWDDHVPASAAGNVYSYASDLRRLLGQGSGDPPRLRAQAGRYALTVRSGELDADRFDELVGDGLDAAGAGRYPVAIERLTRALGLWRSDRVLEGVDVPDVLRPAATRLEQLRTCAAEALVDCRLAHGEHAALLPELQSLVDRHPLHEPWWEKLMRAQYGAGRPVDALATYQRARARLAEELGIEPGPQLRAVHQQVLNADPDLEVPGTAQPAPAQLPADLTVFTGRSGELDRLTAIITRRARSEHPADGPVLVAAIDGMAGVGKTALATRVAHRVRPLFPDGQIFLDLHGHTEEVAPVDPADALDRLLRSLGVQGGQIPPDLDGRAALFRTRVAGRRMLVVLDNAAGERQVRPLLPGSPGCVVLITSRAALNGLDNVTAQPLDLLPLQDAADLFARVAGADRLAAEPAELLDEVARLCGRLPLAIRIAAARLYSRSSWTLEDLAGRLRDEERRLTELEFGERSVAATFGLSYRQLDPGRRRTFRLLGLHPGQDLEPYAVAALVDGTVEQAGHQLEEFLDAHLLMQRQPGRYVLHDLLRAHAAATASREDAEPIRSAALGRLLDHYAVAASAAADVLYPSESAYRSVPRPAATPAPVLTGRTTATAWLDAEMSNLLGAAGVAPGRGRPDHTIEMSQILASHLRIRALHDQALSLHHAAAIAAGRTGDRLGELRALRDGGGAHFWGGRFAAAADSYQRALDIADESGYTAEAMPLFQGLGSVHRYNGKLELARENFWRALGIARQVGDRAGETRLLTSLGTTYTASGDQTQARACYEQALEIAREVGDRLHEGSAANSLAVLHAQLGQLAEALRYGELSLHIAREVGSRHSELGALAALGLIHRQAGHFAEAADHFHRALDIADEIGSQVGEAMLRSGLGKVYVEGDRPDDAITELRAALVLSRRVDDRNVEFEALHGLGRALAAAGRTADALDHQRQALNLATELGQVHDQGRAHDGLATILRDLGDLDGARAHWQQALSIFTELDAPEAEPIRSRLADLERGADARGPDADRAVGTGPTATHNLPSCAPPADRSTNPAGPP